MANDLLQPIANMQVPYRESRWSTSQPDSSDAPVPWWKYRLSDSMKGLLVALFGGGVPAGFVGPFSHIANATSQMPSLEILFFRCLLHLFIAFWLCWKKAPLFGPPDSWKRVLLHAVVNVISVGCAYSSYMVVPTGNAATVRKGSSTVSSTLLALCMDKEKLTGYNWLGLLGSTVGLLFIVVPSLLKLDEKTRIYDILGYILATMGGLALALGLVIFRTFDFKSKLATVIFVFGAVGSVFSTPAMWILQSPIIPQDPLSVTCVVAISVLALVSFLCASYAVTITHPALVCAVLHSEVVVTMTVQYYVLREAVSPFDVVGAGVIIGSIAVITAQNVSCDREDLMVQD
ncbi:solute carrier family 35 member G3-like [Rhinatrema bivittatum]|uniref:solute carrier family 35 member G3-like n=1 Tax=Rhinatrema bivittatum TaxID=194408 RepID=UPI0011268737|nr:solute carrier family 35 member G3-like [Rhinatrema bivittatum]XP_029435314.1 solute carrier family 35 member G3-like [Rhinatrema bivittatum]XP_029435315.1 solute carrier family 35 member G3-like [Rhinatrema bivittatum]XP_029435316.1 solute carrier family 35 member G3-like [Rhinatrema bivittatum]